jgi:hypothetical protein
MEQTNLLLSIKYDLLGRLWSFIFWTISMLIGGMFVFLGLMEKLLFLIGIFVFIFSLVKLIDVVFFEKMEFFENRIVKKWKLFGSNELEIKSLKTNKGNGIFGGTLVFWKDGSRMKHIMLFGLDLLPIASDDIVEIKNVLIKLNVIKGDENDWID